MSPAGGGFSRKGSEQGVARSGRGQIRKVHPRCPWEMALAHAPTTVSCRRTLTFQRLLQVKVETEEKY